MNSIEIRKYKEGDINSFYQAVSSSIEEISKWLPWCDENYSIKDTDYWIKVKVPQIWQSKKGCEFVIINTTLNQVIGGCCLEQLDLVKKEANIGYWVKKDESNKGVATIASNYLLTFGFEQLKLEKIKVIPSKENSASVRVAEKLPFEEIIEVKDGFKIGDSVSDALIFVITKESYIKKTS